MSTGRGQGALCSGLGFKRQAADVFGRQGDPRIGEVAQNVGDVVELRYALSDEVLRSSLLRLSRLFSRHGRGRRGRNGGGGSGDRACGSGVRWGAAAEEVTELVRDGSSSGSELSHRFDVGHG